MPIHDHLWPASRLVEALESAAQTRRSAVAVMVTSEHCPWCQLLKEEQLLPRMRAEGLPRLIVIAFDTADRTAMLWPQEAASPTRRRSPRDWIQHFRYRVTPTVIMLDARAQPLGTPLVGYSSRDFYGAYLEKEIIQAIDYWKNL